MSEDIKTDLSETITDQAISNSELPFEICQENSRNFIKIEFSAPITVRNLMELLNDNMPFENLYEIKGEILNISDCGMLVEMDALLNDNDLVLINMSIQDNKEIENVVGLVKKSELINESSLAGIEFMDAEKLKDRLSGTEYDLLSEHITTFETELYNTLQNQMAVN